MIKKVKAYFGQSEFARSTLILTSGTALAQLLPLLMAPVLTRLYTPEEFATFGLFSALVSILGVISTGKYEFAVLLPTLKREAIAVLFLSIVITVAFGLFIAIVIFLMHDQIVILFGNPDIGVWLYLLPFAIIFSGLYQSLNFWRNREKAYIFISRGKVIRSIITNVINLVLGLFRIGIQSISAVGLISGLVIGQAVEILFLSRSDWDYWPKSKAIFRLIKKEVKTLGKRYSDFPKYDVPSELMITASVQLPVLLLNRFFEQSVVGLYFYAHRILSLPLSLIGSSIAQVLFKQLTDLRSQSTALASLVNKTYDRLITLGALPFSVIGVFGPEIFQLVFGEAWKQSGDFASIISPWLLFNFAASPLTMIFSVFEKQKQMFIWILMMFVTRVGALYIGFLYFGDVYYSIFLFSASGALFYFGMNFYMVCGLAGVKTINFLKSTFLKPVLILGVILFLKFLISFL